MTLTEFLLARYAEDEDSVSAYYEAMRAAVRRAGHPPVETGLEDADPARVLADRKAQHPCPTLRLLALPYADHPDYREDWRP